MDVVPILSTVILIATLITLVVAVASYLVFRIKEKRKGHAITDGGESEGPPTLEGASEEEL